MSGRRAVLSLPALLLPGLATAQPSPAATPRRRRRPAASPAPPPPPPPAPASRGEPAPVPNPDIEAPRDRSASTSPRLDPALIDPNEPRVGATSDPHSVQSREDRLLRQPAPGARLRVPFAY